MLKVGVWGLPPRKMLVCLYPSTSIRHCLVAGKSLLYAIIIAIGKILGRGEFECLVEMPPP